MWFMDEDGLLRPVQACRHPWCYCEPSDAVCPVPWCRLCGRLVHR